MLDKIVINVGLVIKNKDIHKLAIDGAINMYSLFVGKDITALPTVIADTKDIMALLPNIIFADKMYLFLTKVFSDYEMQIKFASRFEKNDDKYYDTVKKQLQLLDRMEFDDKIDWFANLTRAVCLECIDIDKYIRLSTAVSMLMVEDLKALKDYYGRTNVRENSTLFNYYAYGLTTKIIFTRCGASTAEHTLSVSGVELLKYGIDYENCEKYRISKEKQDGESE